MGETATLRVGHRGTNRTQIRVEADDWKTLIPLDHLRHEDRSRIATHRHRRDIGVRLGQEAMCRRAVDESRAKCRLAQLDDGAILIVAETTGRDLPGAAQ